MEDNLIERQRKAVKERGLDALIATSWENVAYTGGVLIPTQPKLRRRIAATLVPAIGDPAIVVVDMEYTTVKRYGRIKDIRAYAEFKEDPIEVLAQTIKDKGLINGRIGFEGKAMAQDDFEQLRKKLPTARFSSEDPVFTQLRMVKSKKEIDTLCLVGQMADCAHRRVQEEARLGMTEQDIARIITDELMKQGADSVSILCVAAGDRSGLPNVSASNKELKKGDLVRIDIIATLNGYHSDVARTGVVGKPSASQESTWAKFVDTYYSVLENVKPGVRTSELYRIYKDKFTRYGLPISTFYGHGLGITVHEEPYIGEQFDDVLKEGMVLCLEPFILGEKEGFQLENEVVVTRRGHKLITDITSIDDLFIIPV